MKKVNLILSLSFLLGLSYGLSNIQIVDAQDERSISINPAYGIGYSVNLVKDECLDVYHVNNSVLDASSIKVNSSTLSSTSTIIKHSNDFNDLVEQIDNHYNLDSSCSTSNYSLFTGTVASKFPEYEEMEYVNYPYQYYSTYIFTYKTCQYSLENYNTNLTNIIRCLNGDYIDDLDALLNEDLDVDYFFDTYGTHIVGSFVAGGRLEINYSIVSEHYDVWGEKYNSLTNYLNSSLYSKVQNSGASISFDPQTNCDVSPIASNQYIDYQTQGGTPFTITDITQINKMFNSWKNSVVSNSEMIEPTSDGLIPLWDLLPGTLNTSSYRNLFISKYNQYMENSIKEVESNYIPTIVQEKKGDTGFRSIRTGTLVVTDESEFDQHADVADLNDFADIKYDYFKHYGFKKINIFLRMEAKEIHMGYQHIYFYYSEKHSTDYMISSHTTELGGGSLQSSYTIMTYYTLDIPLSTFDNADPDDYAKFVARYSASGTFEDDWQNMAIYLCVVYHD